MLRGYTRIAMQQFGVDIPITDLQATQNKAGSVLHEYIPDCEPTYDPPALPEPNNRLSEGDTNGILWETGKPRCRIHPVPRPGHPKSLSKTEKKKYDLGRASDAGKEDWDLNSDTVIEKDDEWESQMSRQGEKDGLVDSWLNTGRQHEKRLAKYEQLIQAAPERVRSVFEGTVGVCMIDETLDGLEDIEEEDVYSVEGEDETNDADDENAGDKDEELIEDSYYDVKEEA